MFKRTKLSAGLLLAFGGAIASTAAAQQALERVEITGSAIRRVESEGALPVQIIKREEIEKTGATSLADLLQKLPSIQNATTESSSVGGGGGGFAGASIHGIGENRTLVLLNGRRMAAFGGQTLTGFGAGTDLNTIPIAALDRVEILTDGASALYGSDAIAGVVNFITKRNSQVGDISVGISDPEGKGGTERRVSLTKGFGDIDADGYNLLLSFSADKRTPLNGVDRSFAKTGVINFSNNGQRYQAFLGSPSAIPGNVLDDDGDIVSPYFLANGTCAPGNVRAIPNPDQPDKVACYFDFVAALEIFPERERKNFVTSFTKTIGENHEFYADLLLSRNESTGIIAPVPGSVSIPLTSPLYDQYLTPVSGINGSTFTADTVAFYRVSDLGRRADKNKSDFRNIVLGFKGTLADWDYNTAFTSSQNKYENDISGYPGALALSALRASGLLNPFVGPGEQPQESLDAIRGIVYNGYWDGGTSKLNNFDLTVSRELAQLSGGPLAMALGFNYYQEKFQGKPSLFAQALLTDPITGELCDPDDPALPCDQRFGDSAAFIPYSADRKVYGLFTEFNAPIAKGFELTAALRFDDYNDVGNTTNGKAGFRWTPTQGLLVRGSVGTGFKAPTVPQLKAAAQSFGVTSAPYDCTPELLAIATSLGAVCQPNGRQYDVLAGGNALLEPEKSRQASLGIVFEPTPGVSVGADYWFVAIRDAYGQISEDAAFANPGAYPGSWGTQLDIATGITYLAYNQSNLNLGKEYYSGIDFNIQARDNTDLGTLTTQLVATYMLRDDRQLVPGGEYYSAIGKNEDNLSLVTFRWQGRLTTSLKTGNWLHTLQANFKSGYTDALATVEVLGPGDVGTGTYEDVRLKIKPFVSFDWQTQWQATKALSLTAGILNVLDKDPPLSLAEGGSGKGQQYGYDDRYYDSRGRTYYLNASYAF